MDSSFAPAPSLSAEVEQKKRRREPLEEHEKKTVFVCNLPSDVTQRELHNMFYFWPGFMKVSLWRNDEKTNAFVLFESSQAAIDGRDRLARYVFDADQNSVLHTKLALKNLVLSREERATIMEQRIKAGGGDYYQPPPQQWGGAFHPGMNAQDPNAMYAPYGQDPSFAYGAYGQQPQAYAPYGAPPSQPAYRGGGGSGGGGGGRRRAPNPPCTTLFLAKIDALTDEALVQFIRMNCTGYKDHKFANDRSGQRVSFFEFQSVENATESLTTINGHQGIQAAFAKNPLNQRRF